MLSKYRHFFSMFKLWNRYCMSSNNQITRKVLLWDFKQNINSWGHELNLICQHIICSEPIFGEVYNLTIVKNHILAKQENEWRETLLNKPKLRTYITFKTNFYTEKYVQKYTCKRERSLLAQLCVGILPLEIKTGRYRGIAIEERLCQFCKSLVENEVHFLNIFLTLQVSTYCLLSFLHLQNSRLRRCAYIEQTPVWQIPKLCAILVQCWTNTWLW